MARLVFLCTLESRILITKNYEAILRILGHLSLTLVTKITDLTANATSILHAL
jgi:hypothetical protein